MPRCGEAFFFGLFLLPTLCRDAAKHFPLASSCYQPYASMRRGINPISSELSPFFFCYQPYAAMRRGIFLWPLLATNLMPRCGEAFSFGLFLLPTLCLDAARY